MPQELHLHISLHVYASLEELPEAGRQLMHQARQAAEKAYAPYSNFLVGTALLLSDGSVVTGNNQENAAYPSGICAERTALFAMSSQKPDAEVTLMAIAARRRDNPDFLPVTSCGACRQVMSEYEQKQGRSMQVLMQGPDNTFYLCHTVQDLLPLQFNRKSMLV